MKQLTVSIYEGDNPEPVLAHTAYGATYQEAEAIIRTHARYDSFLRAALTGRPFQGMVLHLEVMRSDA